MPQATGGLSSLTQPWREAGRANGHWGPSEVSILVGMWVFSPPRFVTHKVRCFVYVLTEVVIADSFFKKRKFMMGQLRPQICGLGLPFFSVCSISLSIVWCYRGILCFLGACRGYRGTLCFSSACRGQDLA